MQRDRRRGVQPLNRPLLEQLNGGWVIRANARIKIFGRRQVFERIKQKGLTESGRLKQRVEDFGPADVTEEVRGRAKGARVH